MSHAEYLDWLVKIGCGWLGWPPDVVEYSPMRNIHIAYRGLVEKLQACYGVSEKGKSEKQETIETEEQFDAIFG